MCKWQAIDNTPSLTVPESSINSPTFPEWSASAIARCRGCMRRKPPRRSLSRSSDALFAFRLASVICVVKSVIAIPTHAVLFPIAPSLRISSPRYNLSYHRQPQRPGIKPHMEARLTSALFQFSPPVVDVLTALRPSLLHVPLPCGPLAEQLCTHLPPCTRAPWSPL